MEDRVPAVGILYSWMELHSWLDGIHAQQAKEKYRPWTVLILLIPRAGTSQVLILGSRKWYAVSFDFMMSTDNVRDANVMC